MCRTVSRFSFLLAAFLGTATFAASDGAKALVTLLDSRAAQSPKVYAAAARLVKADADRGQLLQRFVLAVVSGDPDMPAEVRLDAATRAAYLEETRPKIRAFAERTNNALAWYVLSLEKDDPALMKRAAEGGNIQAQNAWGTYLVLGALERDSTATNGVPERLARGFSLFSAAAGRGDANGLYNLGLCYMNGYGCKRDPERAIQCFRTAAEKGHPEAINNIGGCYRDGIVVKRDLALSVRWFRKSAELGNVYGRLNCALAQLRGEGVERNAEAAAKTLRELAEAGNTAAMSAYMMCLREGTGVRRDPVEAARWRMRQRAAEGDEAAKRWLETEAKRTEGAK